MWTAHYEKMLKDRGIDNTHGKLAMMMAALRTKQSAGNKGISFIGGVGTGKTVRMQLLNEVLGGRYADAVMLFSDAEHYLKDNESFDHVINYPSVYCDNPFRYYLFLDDIGNEPKEAVSYGERKDIMENVVRRRYTAFMQGHITCFASNLTESELMQRYGERIVSRMKEMTFFIDMTGADRRLQKNRNI